MIFNGGKFLKFLDLFVFFVFVFSPSSPFFVFPSTLIMFLGMKVHLYVLWPYKYILVKSDKFICHETDERSLPRCILFFKCEFPVCLVLLLLFFPHVLSAWVPLQKYNSNYQSDSKCYHQPINSLSPPAFPLFFIPPCLYLAVQLSAAHHTVLYIGELLQ